MDDRPREPQPPEDPVMRFMDEWFWPFVEEGTLWPVLFAVLAHLSVLLAILFLQAWRIRAAWAWAGIVFLGLIAFDLVRREYAIRKRPGRVALIVALVWAAGALTAVLTGWWGIF
jgi:hypothetical protein